MNILKGTIVEIEQNEGIALVKIGCGENIFFTSMIVDVPHTNNFIAVNKKINIVFKETEIVVLKKYLTEISVRNQLPCLVQSIKKGKLLTQLNLLFGTQNIVAIITTTAYNLLHLTQGENVIALVNYTNLILQSYD